MFSNIFAQAWKFAVVGVIAFLIGSVVNTTVTGSVAVTNLPTVQDVQLVGSTIGTSGDIVNLSIRTGCGMLDREIQKDDLCEDTNGDGIVDIPKACAAQVGFSYVVPEGKVYQITDINVRNNSTFVGLWTSQDGLIFSGRDTSGVIYQSPIEVDAGEMICPVAPFFPGHFMVSGRLIDAPSP